MRNKSEASKSKCPICREYLKTHTHYSDICIINNENMETCDNNQWQAGEIENKSKLDEAREYYKSCVKSSNDATYVYKEVGDLYDKYEFAIKELEDKIYELQGEVNDEANEVAKLKEKIKQQPKIDDNTIADLKYIVSDKCSCNCIAMAKKLLDYFGVE